MITLLTGLPGNGKTLLALEVVANLCEKEGRPLFVMGIELSDAFPVPWQPVPPLAEWTQNRPSPQDDSVLLPYFTFPQGAVLLVDECQNIYRPRAASVKPPDHVAALETHRHTGIDIFLITQHPMLVDQAVRRLAGRHFHVVRAFGAQAAQVHEWNEVNPAPDKSRKGSQKRPWKYPKKIYTWYKSAELHTHKFRLPPRLLALLLMPVTIIAAVWYIWHFADKQLHPDKYQEAPSAEVAPAPGGTPAQAPTKAQDAGKKDEGRTVAEYVTHYKPRIDGLPYTAPAYDNITQPIDPPFPAVCYTRKNGCKCYTQQGTRIAMDIGLCQSIVADGLYMAWKVPEGAVVQGEERPQQLAKK